MRNLPAYLWSLPLLFTALAACAGPGHGDGRLVIVGGGLATENAAVHRAFVEGALPGRPIIVLPTASGVPLESGPGTVADLALYRQPDQTVEVLDIQHDTPERASEPDSVARLAGAGGVWFTGGVQSRILAVFRPDSGDTPAYEALARGLREGIAIGGSSAGAAMMSDPMIAWGNSREALLVGARADVEDRAVAIERGMGFFPYGFTDQHFLRRGRFGRLIVALEATGERFGFGVAEDRALVVHLARDRGVAVGDRAVVVIDAAELQREGLSRTGLRVSLLSDGDEVDLEDGEVDVAPGKPAVPPGAAPDDAEPLEPWGRYTLARLIERLARDPSRDHRARGDAFEVVVSADLRTRFHAREADLRDLSAVGVRLDVLALEGADAKAEEVRAALERGEPAP